MIFIKLEISLSEILMQRYFRAVQTSFKDQSEAFNYQSK